MILKGHKISNNHVVAFLPVLFRLSQSSFVPKFCEYAVTLVLISLFPSWKYIIVGRNSIDGSVLGNTDILAGNMF